jgi:hypothetical protein
MRARAVRRASAEKAVRDIRRAVSRDRLGDRAVVGALSG